MNRKNDRGIILAGLVIIMALISVITSALAPLFSPKVESSENNNNAQVAIITFTIDGTTYRAEEGMTWADWVNSDYNIGYGYKREKFIVNENDVVIAESFGALYYKEDITPAFGSDTILANDTLGIGNLNNPILPIL